MALDVMVSPPPGWRTGAAFPVQEAGYDAVILCDLCGSPLDGEGRVAISLGDVPSRRPRRVLMGSDGEPVYGSSFLICKSCYRPEAFAASMSAGRYWAVFPLEPFLRRLAELYLSGRAS